MWLCGSFRTLKWTPKSRQICQTNKRSYLTRGRGGTNTSELHVAFDQLMTLKWLQWWRRVSSWHSSTHGHKMWVHCWWKLKRLQSMFQCGHSEFSPIHGHTRPFSLPPSFPSENPQHMHQQVFADQKTAANSSGPVRRRKLHLKKKRGSSLLLNLTVKIQIHFVKGNAVQKETT